MSNIVSIHQPSYFPWLGLLDKIDKSDIYIFLDDVQLADRAYQHRNIFMNNYTKKHLLTIPINKKEYRTKSIKDILLANNIWQRKHLSFLKNNYRKYPFFDEVYDLIKPLYKTEYLTLSDVLMESMIISCSIFNIDTPIIKSSTLILDDTLVKEEKILDILDAVNATKYLSGEGARVYQNEENFINRNFELEYQNFKHPLYSQYKNKNFIEGLACLDIAFNIGLEESSFLFKGNL
ncbi:MAG TPA: hypothetical protein ENK88_00035 [Campylobacterales bacterium]|nr:hypothetical protein [Campylobacterales bacterium]